MNCNLSTVEKIHGDFCIHNFILCPLINPISSSSLFSFHFHFYFPCPVLLPTNLPNYLPILSHRKYCAPSSLPLSPILSEELQLPTEGGETRQSDSRTDSLSHHSPFHSTLPPPTTSTSISFQLGIHVDVGTLVTLVTIDTQK